MTPRSGDAFQSESQKVQESVRKIQQHAGDIRKEANLLSTSPSHSVGKGKEKAQSIVREAKATNDAALLALQGLARATTGGVGDQALELDEQNSRKFMHQKLTENMNASMKAVDQAFLAYEAAEAEAIKRQAAPASSSMATPLIAAGMDPSLPSSAEAADLEAGRQSQATAQMQEDVLPGETEIHTAIAEEYARDLTNLNQDMHHLQRAMVDLADVTTAQGEVLDSIEQNMSSAVETSSQANEELLQTVSTQRRGTKRFMWLLAIAGTAAAVGAMFS